MKMLFLVRHAKSSQQYDGASDFERPLSKRGLEDAPKIGERLKSRGIVLDLLISSPAVRAATTAELLAEQIGYEKDRILFEPQLYLCDVADFLGVLSAVDERVVSVMLVAHNPGITDFFNFLCRADICNMPTAAVAEIELDLQRWDQIKAASGRVVCYDPN